ncbi:MAG TPA: glycosyl hydrolase, partial [Bacteroidales bacterium]|nr:glycosyl hydrolase [Bacteroidales bacterium]
YKWLVMTDWISVWDGEKLIKSGQDLEMPYRSATKHADKLLKKGKITEAEIDRMVKSMLRTFISMNSFRVEKKPLTDTDYNKFKETALNTAREGIVLLRNNNSILPIDKSKNLRILVTGEYLDEFISGKG